MARHPRARFQFGWNNLYRTANSHIADITSGAANYEPGRPVQLLYPDSATIDAPMSGVVSYLQDSPDNPDDLWINMPDPGQTLEQNYLVDSTFVFKEVSAVSPAQANTQDGWIIRNVAAGLSSEFTAEVEKTAATFTDDTTDPKPGVPSSVTANGIRLPATAMTAVLPAQTWQISFSISAATANPTGAKIRFKYRIFKGSAQDGSNAVEIGTQTYLSDESAVINATNQTVLANVDMPYVILNGEFIFITVACLITVGGAGNAGADVNIKVGPNTLFSFNRYTNPVDTNIILNYPTPTKDLRSTQTFRVLARKRGTGFDPTISLHVGGSGMTEQIGSTTNVTSQTGQIITYTPDHTLMTNPSAVSLLIVMDNKGHGAIDIGAAQWQATGWSSGIVLLRTANTIVASITTTANRFRQLIRLANSFTATVTSTASRLAHLIRLANSYTATVTSTASRLAMAKSRLANSYVESITSLSHAVKIFYRLANSNTETITAYASGHLDKLRTALSFVSDITGVSNRLSIAKSRLANSYISGITSNAARSIASKLRNVLSYSDTITSLSSRNPLSKTRLANSHSDTISSISNRLIDKLRTASSWIDSVTSHSDIIRNLHLTANSYVASITSYTSLANLVIRSAVSYVQSITSESTRLNISWRSVISNTDVFTGMSNRVIDKLRSSNSYVAVITAYASGFRELVELVRSANSYIATITSKSERLNFQYRLVIAYVRDIVTMSSRFIRDIRQANSSEESVTSSATRVINKTRHANSHIENITARAVMEGVEPNQYFPYFTNIELGKKVHATVTVDKKRHSKVDLITD